MTEADTYPAVVETIEGDAVARFAEAVAADPADGVPPTFATVYAIQHGVNQMLADSRLGVAVERMLHGEQDLTWRRHPRVGEVLTTRSRIASDEMRGALRRVAIESVAADARGETVCVATTVMVVR